MKNITIGLVVLSVVLCAAFLGWQAIDIAKSYQLSRAKQIEGALTD